MVEPGMNLDVNVSCSSVLSESATRSTPWWSTIRETSSSLAKAVASSIVRSVLGSLVALMRTVGGGGAEWAGWASYKLSAKEKATLASDARHVRACVVIGWRSWSATRCK